MSLSSRKLTNALHVLKDSIQLIKLVLFRITLLSVQFKVVICSKYINLNKITKI